MSHTQTVIGSNGNWTFNLPDQVILTQGASSNLYLDAGITVAPPLVFNVLYDIDAFNANGGMLTISIIEPPNNVDSGFNGLRGNIEIRFFNELGVPIQQTANGALGFFLNGPGDVPDDVNFHTTYAHFHGVTDDKFPGHTVTNGVAITPGNIEAPNVVTVNGAIGTESDYEDWGAFTFHQRQGINKNDNFTFHIFPQPGAVTLPPNALPSADLFVNHGAIDTRNLRLDSLPASLIDPSNVTGPELLSYSEYNLEAGYALPNEDSTTNYGGVYAFDNANPGVNGDYIGKGVVRDINNYGYYYDPDYVFFNYYITGVHVDVDDFITLAPLALSARIFRGHDTLSGYDQADILDGFAGDDWIDGGEAGDTIDGGEGVDTASYLTSGAGVQVRLTTGAGLGGTAQGDTLFRIENIGGSLYADTLVGNGDANRIEGFAGADTIIGNGGADTLVGGGGDDLLDGGSGADLLFGGAALDTVSYFSSPVAVQVRLTTGQALGGDAAGDQFGQIENLTGSAFNDTLVGSHGVANTLNGQQGDDTLLGWSGMDTLLGGAGSDLLDGGADADVLSGGANVDTVSYAGSASRVEVRLTTGLGTFGDAAGDTYSSIENVTGSGFDDILVGDDAGNNILRGGNGADTLLGRGGADTLLGGDGDDVLDGGANADAMNGGAGNDTISYAGATTQVEVRLTTGAGKLGHANFDSYASIENVVGSSFGDTIVGSNGVANRLEGGAGADTLIGNSGNDILTGGLGKDTLLGGQNNDAFMFASAADSAVGVNRDTIFDFEDAADNDSIVLTGFAGVLSFIGVAAFSAANQVRAVQSGANVLVQINTTGTTGAESEILLANTALAQIDASDFFL